MGTILLYYKYVDIQYPEAIMKWQRSLCESLGLLGRIIVAHEGINGTVGGTNEACQAYIKAMNEHEYFGNIDFKTAEGGAHAFPKLSIKVKNEIVSLGIDPTKVTVKDSGEHLTPEETHRLISESPEDLIIFDARSDYETNIGKFAGSIAPNIGHFRKLPEYIDQNIDQFKDKTVLMTCTGGVKCERASAYLQQKKVTKKIYQMSGGVHRYIEKYPDGHFEGKMYVFDKRISVKPNDKIIGSCLRCSTKCDEYYNCLNVLCNKHFISCNACVEKFNTTCSLSCQQKLATNEAAARTPLEKI